ANARADFRIFERSVYRGGERPGNDATNEIEAVVDVEPILAVAEESPNRIGEVLASAFAPSHKTELLVRREPERADRERALYEGNELVARSILHRKGRVVLAHLEVQDGQRFDVDPNVGRGGANRRRLGRGVASRRRGGGRIRRGRRGFVGAARIVD